MKPVFIEEINFFEKKTGVRLPNECWRDGKSFYLNGDKKTLIIQFTIDNKRIKIKKNKIDEVLEKYKNKTWQEEIDENKDRLNDLERNSIDKTKRCMEKFSNSNWRVSDSGGKDSALCMRIFQKAYDELGSDKGYDVDFFNTTNDTADTYKRIKANIIQVLNHQLKRIPAQEEIDVAYKLWIHNPEMGWYQWLKEVKSYYLPSIMVRNCCSTYKEGSLKKLLDKKEDYVLLLGMRKYESSKRSEYDYYLNERMNELFEQTGKSKYKLNVPANWVRFLPCVEWYDKDVWLYILREEIEFNRMYRLGFNRVGCLLCPYASDYVDLLIEEQYEFLWNRWCEIVEKNYDLYNVGNRLKWSKEEYIQGGKWKTATSKTQEYITKKPTEERVKVVSELYGISEDMARKYFKQNCSCGKKLNPDEVSMFLKLFGRYENREDDRTYLCKECLCDVMNITKGEYAEKVRDFRNSGCNLF